MIAHGNLDHAEAPDGSFENHFNGPAIRLLFERKRVQYIGAGGAEWAEVADVQTIEARDQTGCEAIAKRCVPRQRAGACRLRKA